MKSTYMRRGQVVEWLIEEGLKEHQVRTLLECRAIIPLYLPGKKAGRALYSRAQIERDVVRRMEADAVGVVG